MMGRFWFPSYNVFVCISRLLSHYVPSLASCCASNHTHRTLPSRASECCQATRNVSRHGCTDRGFRGDRDQEWVSSAKLDHSWGIPHHKQRAELCFDSGGLQMRCPFFRWRGGPANDVLGNEQKCLRWIRYGCSRTVASLVSPCPD